MMMWAVVLLLSPLIFLGVVLLGIRFMSPDEIDLLKVLLVVIGPFAFDFWWITIRYFSARSQVKQLIAEHNETGDDLSEAELRFLEQVGKPRHLRNLGVLLTSLVGSILGALLFHNSGNVQFVIGVLAGIFSPAIVIIAYKMFPGFN
jgi:hypothetical protein